MKKRIIATVIASSMLFGVAAMTSACSSDTSTDEEVEESEEEEEEDDEEPSETEATETEAPSDDLASLDTALWSVSYDDSLWQYEEDYMSDSDTYCYATFYIPGATEDDANVCEVIVEASISSASSFRDSLYNRGFDELTYSEGGYDTVNVAGLDFLEYEGYYWGWDAKIYFNRFVNEGATVEIIVSDPTNADAQALVDNITFNLTDTGNVDIPWSWEGEPINNGSFTASVDSYTLTSTQLVMDEAFISHDTFDERIGVVGDSLYILDQNIMRKYTIADGALVFDQEFELDDDYTEMCVTTDGRIFLSAFFQVIEWNDGEIVQTIDGVDYLSVSPDGTWGVSWFAGSDVDLVDIAADGTTTLTPVTLETVGTVSAVNVYDDCFIVSGYNDESSEAEIYVYNRDGSLDKILTETGEDWGIGSVTFVAKTSNGFMAMDGNMRTVAFWSNDGTYIGKLEDSDLFGTWYPWFCGSCIAADGTFYTVMTEDRDDESAMEAIVFTVDGF